MYAKVASFVSQFSDLFIGIPCILLLFPFLGEIFTAYQSIFGGREMLDENVFVRVSLIHSGVASSPSAGILTSLICFQVFAERIELHVT